MNKLLVLTLLCLAPYQGMAKDKEDTTLSQLKKTKGGEKIKKQKKKAKGSFHVADSTDIDFEAASIEGRMKAPMGFLLRGRKSNAMENMVKLRTNFRQELEDSKAGVISISPATP